MATDTIRRLMITPPIAIARLGGSTTPMDAFEWTLGDPHTIAETRIRPAWTLDVDAMGNVSPRMPTELAVRDGARVRPVAPFLELWALTGDGPAESWTPVPVTPALLAANGTDLSQLAFTVTATNVKAARRTRNPNVGFGTFPPVVVSGDAHQAVPLRGQSPPGATPKMIPTGRFIPLGTVQVMRPAQRPADAPWPETVRVDAVRLRFTPAAGLAYGPPQATQTAVPAVANDQAFLDPAGGWFGRGHGDRAIPADTIDEQDGPPETQGQHPSLGVVDDTCDVRVAATLTRGGDTLRAHANIFVGPPHFAPDRRPFLSLADEINDRQHDPARDEAMSPEQRAAWVEDLFERIYETAALMDVDFHRLSGRLNRLLADDELRPAPIPDDGVPFDNAAMGGRDRLRDPDIAIPAPSQIEPRPVAARARERHRALSDLSALIPFVLADPDRLRELVRPPFVVSEADPESGRSMQMPPFMLNSNARILNLARWQYDLLMAWVDELVAGPGAFAAPAPELSPEAEERRRQVLALLDEQGDS